MSSPPFHWKSSGPLVGVSGEPVSYDGLYVFFGGVGFEVLSVSVGDDITPGGGGCLRDQRACLSDCACLYACIMQLRIYFFIFIYKWSFYSTISSYLNIYVQPLAPPLLTLLVSFHFIS